MSFFGQRDTAGVSSGCIGCRTFDVSFMESSSGLGFCDEEMDKRTALYADDLLLFIRQVDRSLPVVMHIINQFRKYSGLNI